MQGRAVLDDASPVGYISDVAAGMSSRKACYQGSIAGHFFPERVSTRTAFSKLASHQRESAGSKVSSTVNSDP